MAATNISNLRFEIADWRQFEIWASRQCQISKMRFKSEVPDPRSQIPKLKSQNSKLKSQISNLKSQISNLKSQISNRILRPESRISNLKSQILNFKFPRRRQRLRDYRHFGAYSRRPLGARRPGSRILFCRRTLLNEPYGHETISSLALLLAELLGGRSRHAGGKCEPKGFHKIRWCCRHRIECS